MSSVDSNASESDGHLAGGHLRHLAGLSVRDLRTLIAAREVSVRQVVDAHIQRIEEVNRRLDAVAFPMFDDARRAADEADARQARGEPLGPLHGIPVTVKDQYYIAGTPTTFGLASRANHRASTTAPAVQKLRDAGAIVVSKGNVPQLLMYQESDNPLYGRSNNPWDLDRSPSGGTGGDAALVATGGAVLGLGSEFSGSIRHPAHVNGICGLKPTTGRMTMTGAPELFFPGFPAIPLVPGMLARNVEDLEIGMRLLAEPDAQGLDASISPLPWGPRSDVNVSGLRVGMYVEDGYFPASPAVRRAVSEAGLALEKRGAIVEEFMPPGVPEAVDLTFALMAADNGRWMKRALRNDDADPRLAMFVRMGLLPNIARRPTAAVLGLVGQRRFARVLRNLRSCSAGELCDLIVRRDRFRYRFQAALDAARLDALICPPYPLPALRHGSTRELFISQCYSIIYNLLGMPAGAVQATTVQPGEESDRPDNRDMVDRAARRTEEGSAGLPVGVQVVARHWREDVALAIMGQLEEHFRTQPGYPVSPPI